jgi:hypothetical protein
MFWVRAFFALGFSAYAAALVLSTLSVYQLSRNAAIAIATVPYIVSTHLWYGIRFLYGFLWVKKLQSKLGR